MTSVADKIAACTLCADRFQATETRHHPRPVVWFQPGARILVAGQAPGLRVHKSGVPFDDPSGDRLRKWMGLDRTAFYDQSKIAILPMAFCFPGYSKSGSDLPPPPICAKTWRADALETLCEVKVTLLIGGYAMKYHLPNFRSVMQEVADWQAHPKGTFALPHPSWRNTGWLKKNPWFEADVVPRLQTTVAKAMHD